MAANWTPRVLSVHRRSLRVTQASLWKGPPGPIHPSAQPHLPGTPHKPQRLLLSVRAAKASSQFGDPLERALTRAIGPDLAPTLVTLGYIAGWYALHLAFNLQNKIILNWFPFPWWVATVHVVVGAAYCALLYAFGAQKASFERPITREEFKAILGPATAHAAGHVASNISFVAVALSLTHTVKTLEPAFSVVLSQLLLGESTPLPALLCLIPIMGGVAAATAAELSFNWTGFSTAILANFTFGLRAVLSKKAMSSIKGLGSTGIYAYTTLISVFFCIPGVLLFERGVVEAARGVIAQHGAAHFWGNMLSVGLLYHLYNQLAFNTLARVSAVSHGVANVVNRIVVIVASVFVFGNVLSPQTKVGTAITLLGTLLYSEAIKSSKQPVAPKPARGLVPVMASRGSSSTT